MDLLLELKGRGRGIPTPPPCFFLTPPPPPPLRSSLIFLSSTNLGWAANLFTKKHLLLVKWFLIMTPRYWGRFTRAIGGTSHTNTPTPLLKGGTSNISPMSHSLREGHLISTLPTPLPKPPLLSSSLLPPIFVSARTLSEKFFHVRY